MDGKLQLNNKGIKTDIQNSTWHKQESQLQMTENPKHKFKKITKKSYNVFNMKTIKKDSVVFCVVV